MFGSWCGFAWFRSKLGIGLGGEIFKLIVDVVFGIESYLRFRVVWDRGCIC